MRLHQELDAVAEALIGFDRDLLDHAPREQTKSVAGIGGREPGKMMEREIGGTHEHPLEPRAADHRAAGHEATGAHDVTAATRQRDHAIDHGGIVVVVGGIHQYKGRSAGRKSAHDSAVRAAAAIAHECEIKARRRIFPDGGQGVVIGRIIADQNACAGSDRRGKRCQRRLDVAAFVVDGNDDLELCRHEAAADFDPAVSTNGRKRSMMERPNTCASTRL